MEGIICKTRPERFITNGAVFGVLLVIDNVFLGKHRRVVPAKRTKKWVNEEGAGAVLTSPGFGAREVEIVLDSILNRFYGAGQGIRGFVTIGHGVERLGGDFGDEALGVDDVAV